GAEHSVRVRFSEHVRNAPVVADDRDVLRLGLPARRFGLWESVKNRHSGGEGSGDDERVFHGKSIRQSGGFHRLIGLMSRQSPFAILVLVLSAVVLQAAQRGQPPKKP